MPPLLHVNGGGSQPEFTAFEIARAAIAHVMTIDAHHHPPAPIFYRIDCGRQDGKPCVFMDALIPSVSRKSARVILWMDPDTVVTMTDGRTIPDAIGDVMEQILQALELLIERNLP